MASNQLTLAGTWGGSWIADLAAPLGSKGGFGRVYEGQSADRIQQVAIKLVETTTAVTPDLAHRELEIVEKLRSVSVTHLIRVLDAGAYAEGFFIVMERATRSLQDAIEAGEAVALDVLEHMATGLEELHGLGVIHRDLKPPNVLDCAGVWKLADFGIARDVAVGTGTHTFQYWGTPEYMSPEQWEGRSPTVKTDLYALGCVAFELLVGHPPFAGDHDVLREKHRLEAPPPLPDSVPHALRSLVIRLLSKDPQERQQDARAVRERLARIVEAPSEMAERLHRIAAEHDVEISAAESARLKAEAKAEHIASLRRQAIADLDEIVRECQSELELTLPDVTLSHRPGESWIIRSEHGQVAVVDWQETLGNVDEPGRFIVAVVEVRGANRRHSQPLSLANLVCRPRDGRLVWTVLRFRAQVGLRSYEFGPTNHDHGLARGKFVAEYESGLLPDLSAMHVYRLSTSLLSPAVLADLFAEALEL